MVKNVMVIFLKWPLTKGVENQQGSGGLSPGQPQFLHQGTEKRLILRNRFPQHQRKMRDIVVVDHQVGRCGQGRQIVQRLDS